MNLTVAFLLSLVILITIFDVWIIAKKGKSESISAHIIRWTYKHKKPFYMGIAIGIVLGHLFWSMPTDSVYKNTKREEVIK